MLITPITSQEDKDFMREMIFGGFNIVPEYIKSQNITENIEVYNLKGESNLEAVLEINFDTMRYKIKTGDYEDETEYIILDNPL